MPQLVLKRINKYVILVLSSDGKLYKRFDTVHHVGDSIKADGMLFFDRFVKWELGALVTLGILIFSFFIPIKSMDIDYTAHYRFNYNIYQRVVSVQERHSPQVITRRFYLTHFMFQPINKATIQLISQSQSVDPNAVPLVSISQNHAQAMYTYLEDNLDQPYGLFQIPKGYQLDDHDSYAQEVLKGLIITLDDDLVPLGAPMEDILKYYTPGE